MSEIKLKVIYPKGVYLEKDVEIVNVRTTVGQLGVMANMLPFTGVLEAGTMNFVEKGQRYHYFVSTGFIYVKKDEVTLITDAIENAADIDLERAMKAKQRAEERIKNRSSKTDMIRAELALKRAIGRINTKNNYQK